MRRYVGTVTLRNEHEVYETVDNYIIESPMGKGGNISKRVFNKNPINTFHEFLKKSEYTVEEVATKIKNSPYHNLLRYQYGHKQNFEIQDILICIVAIGKGSYRKEGRKYYYKIS